MAAARFAVLRALWSPTKTLPHLSVRDIRLIDFAALRRAGYDGVVFDKDNCLTRPLEDAPVNEVVKTLRAVTQLFPPRHVLVVSNSAGAYGDDVEWIEADGVERAFAKAIHSTSSTTTDMDMGVDGERPVHVLRHRRKKPSQRCADEIWDYFERVKAWRQPTTIPVVPTPTPSKIMDVILPIQPLLQPPPSPTSRVHSNDVHPTPTKPRLVFIGDRIMTDILLANDMGAYSIHTTHLWKRNDVVFLRYVESAFVRMVRGWLWLRAREWRRMGVRGWWVMRGVGRGVLGVWNMSLQLVRRARRAKRESVEAKDVEADVLRVGDHSSIHPRVLDVGKKIHPAS